MKLQATYETEIYIGDTGYIVIKQAGPVTEEESIVFLSADQASLVADEMQKLVNELKGAE